MVVAEENGTKLQMRFKKFQLLSKRLPQDERHSLIKHTKKIEKQIRSVLKPPIIIVTYRVTSKINNDKNLYY